MDFIQINNKNQYQRELLTQFFEKIISHETICQDYY